MAIIPFIINVTKSNLRRLKLSFTNPYKKINLNWFNLKYYKHLTPGKIARHTLFGKPLYFSHSMELVNALKEIFIHDVYRQQLSDHPFIIDCGANIGLSIISMKKYIPMLKLLLTSQTKKIFNYFLKILNPSDMLMCHFAKKRCGRTMQRYDSPTKV